MFTVSKYLPYFLQLIPLCSINHSLKNNHIGVDDDQVVMKVLEEHNYTSEHNDHVFELSSAASAGMTLMHMDEEHSAKTSIMEVQHTRQKMFVF